MMGERKIKDVNVCVLGCWVSYRKAYEKARKRLTVACKRGVKDNSNFEEVILLRKTIYLSILFSDFMGLVTKEKLRKLL